MEFSAGIESQGAVGAIIKPISKELVKSIKRFTARPFSLIKKIIRRCRRTKTHSIPRNHGHHDTVCLEDKKVSEIHN